MSVDQREVTVIGLGLIGGSIAKRLLAAGARLSGVDHDAATREDATREGITAVEQPAEIGTAPELVIVAVPPEQTQASVLDALRRWPQALVSDVASVKAPVIPSSGSAGAHGLERYLPGHPLAGSASGGYRASSADAFDDAVWALCPLADTPLALAAELGPFLDALGAVALVCTPAAHDRAVARTSHLPHVLAVSLAATNLIEPAAMIATLSGGALRDSSRIAAADIELWWDILRANREELLSAIDDFDALLGALKQAIFAGDEAGARNIWERGSDAQELIMRSRWSQRTWTDLARPLSDGWAPWREIGERGTVLRSLRIDGENLHAQAS
jgi:prephenate dehydrogenase